MGAKRGGTKLGQNFLVDEAACVRIAEALGDVSDRTVVEIGPGHGAITAHLAARSKSLHCLELDPSLVRELQFRFRNDPGVAVHHRDILQTELSHFLAASSGDPAETPSTLDVVGNLPYYITSDILLHLFAAARAGILRRAVLMVQREVAERLTASPERGEYGALSALAQLHGEVSFLLVLPPGAFSPPPEVYSAVVRVDFQPKFEQFKVNFAGFNPFLRATFAQKRKTLANNLRTAGYTAEQVRSAWPPGLDERVRSEAVPLADLAALYRSLNSGVEVTFGSASPPETD